MCATTECKMSLMIAYSNDLECAICYKPITKTFINCSEPCKKVFHVSCMEQMMDQTEEQANEMGQNAEHKCCYCRRDFDINEYYLQLLARRLMTLKAGGYHVYDALEEVRKQMKENDGKDIEYDIYEIRDVSYQKKPKQSNRAVFEKKTASHQPRIRVKQNIGGRRR